MEMEEELLLASLLRKEVPDSIKRMEISEHGAHPDPREVHQIGVQPGES